MILEKRKKKQQPRVLELIHLPRLLCCVPQVPLGLHMLFNKGVTVQAVFHITIRVGSFKGISRIEENS